MIDAFLVSHLNLLLLAEKKNRSSNNNVANIFQKKEQSAGVLAV